jgi:hypothetical protein
MSIFFLVWVFRLFVCFNLQKLHLFRNRGLTTQFSRMKLYVLSEVGLSEIFFSFGGYAACLLSRALRKTFFSKIFVFASFRNCRFSKIRVGASFSSFYRTRLDSQKLVPTLIFAKKTRKTSRNEPFNKIFESNKKMTFNSSRLDSQKLIPTRKPTRNFG